MLKAVINFYRLSIILFPIIGTMLLEWVACFKDERMATI